MTLRLREETKVKIKANDFHIKKSLGQNFLVDEGILNNIIQAAELSSEDIVMEIGPGLGSLTKLLANKAKKVIGIELDQSIIPLLTKTMAEYSNFVLVREDALKTDFDKVMAENTGSDKGYKVVANLPYYITTPLLMKMLESRYNIITAVVMVQKEVADRMLADPGGKTFGALSVAVQYYSKPEFVVKVPATAFIPPPKVDSAVVKLDIRTRPAVEVKDEALFFRVIKTAFSQRRKTILNNLSNGNFAVTKDEIEEVLQGLSIDPCRRAETLSLEEFARITDRFWLTKTSKGDA